MSKPPVTRVDLTRSGLNKFLGSIETSVMLAVWAEQRTRSDIYTWILAQCDDTLAYSSVSTVIDRLVSKELLVKHIDTNVKPNRERVTFTSPYSSEDAFIDAAVKEVIRALYEDFTDFFQRYF